MLEVNPRASRTVPFVSKATGVQMAKAGARIMTGRTLAELDAARASACRLFLASRKPVFPFSKFPDADPILGPGDEVDGRSGWAPAAVFGEAYAKAQAASGVVLPTRGVCLISVHGRDKPGAVELARKLLSADSKIVAHPNGTAGDRAMPD